MSVQSVCVCMHEELSVVGVWTQVCMYLWRPDNCPATPSSFQYGEGTRPLNVYKAGPILTEASLQTRSQAFSSLPCTISHLLPVRLWWYSWSSLSYQHSRKMETTVQTPDTQGPEWFCTRSNAYMLSTLSSLEFCTLNPGSLWGQSGGWTYLLP